MSVIRITTNFNIELDFVAPPFHRRLGAWLIDTVVQVLYLYFAGEFLSNMGVYESGDRMKSYAFFLLLLLPVLTYHVLCEILMNGQSIGKRIIGIKVISEKGGKPSISQYIIRWLIRTSDIALAGIILSIMLSTLYGNFIFFAGAFGFLMLVVDVILVNTKKQQRLGDILAHTILIEARQRERIEDTIFQEVSQDYVPSFPQVMKLTDRDINALKGILDTARKRNDYNMAEMASQKIKSHLKIDTALSPFDFLEVLLKDYNYLSAN
ncbi:MAG TPA: RDD family protein [Flavisolibacter sp.]|nr:RDD family protein [Flavisolibacter sp.]